MWTLIKYFICAMVLCLAQPSFAQNQRLKKWLQPFVDSLHRYSRVPGLSVGIVTSDFKAISLVAGYRDREKLRPLRPKDRFLGGSTGKTFVSAVGLKLIEFGILDPEANISTYLEHHDWFDRLPNARDITVKMLFNHTSGLVRYEFKESFAQDWVRMPKKNWSVIDRLQYILDQPAPFKAGTKWEYSDTNYIILGQIIEEITGKKYYDLLKHWILRPLHLKDTGPAIHHKIKTLSPGYVGRSNLFGLPDEIQVKGELVINPQVEWTGGGLYCTPRDLSKWAKTLYSHQFFTPSIDSLLYTSVIAKNGNQEFKYGYGVMIRPFQNEELMGHSGFFPGYLTEMYYSPELDASITVQYNTSDYSIMRVTPWQAVQAIVTKLKAWPLH